MAQVVSCQCGQKFSAAEHLAGQTVGCPVCGSSLQIPAVRSQPPGRLVVSCGMCGARYATTRENLGKQLACTKCGQRLVVSDRPPLATPPLPSEDPLAAGGGVSPLRSSTSPLARAARPGAQSKLPAGVEQFLFTLEANKTTLEKIGGAIVGGGVVICTLEMVPGWGLLGHALGLDWPPAVYYLIAALSGAVGGFLIGNRYCVPGMIGYAIGAIGALFAASFPLYYVKSIHTGILLLLTLLGFIPGALIHRGLKFVQDAIFGR